MDEDGDEPRKEQSNKYHPQCKVVTTIGVSGIVFVSRGACGS